MPVLQQHQAIEYSLHACLTCILMDIMVVLF